MGKQGWVGYIQDPWFADVGSCSPCRDTVVECVTGRSVSAFVMWVLRDVTMAKCACLHVT